MADNNESKRKQTLQVRIDKQILDKLKEEARKDRRTVSEYTRNLIQDSLQK